MLYFIVSASRRAQDRYLDWIQSQPMPPHDRRLKEHFANQYLSSLMERIAKNRSLVDLAERVNEPRYPERWLLKENEQARFVILVTRNRWWQFRRLPKAELVYFVPPVSRSPV